MGKSGDDEHRFSFAKLADMNNYKKWAREMQYSLKSAGLWNHTLSDIENPQPEPIVLKGKDLKDDAKFECQEKRVDKIHTWYKNNVKCKCYIGYIYLSHIQQEF